MNTSTTTCIICAEDFQPSTADPNRGRWEVGAMRHVIEALAGQPVIITTDRGTGHSLVNVTLLRVTGTRGGRGHSVVVQSKFEDGTEASVAYPLYKLGAAIIPMGPDHGKGAKWIALDTHRDEASAAIRRAQAEHGEAEGRTNGGWSARLGFCDVSVSYNPYKPPSSMAAEPGTVGAKFDYWVYPTRELVAEAVA